MNKPNPFTDLLDPAGELDAYVACEVIKAHVEATDSYAATEATSVAQAAVAAIIVVQELGDLFGIETPALDLLLALGKPEGETR